MATTAQWVFEKAMHLMDEVNESTGSVDTPDNKSYKNRAVHILNVLRIECFPLSDNYQVGENGKRPVCPVIEALESEIGMDDTVCQGVLPYGLAAHLLVDENPDMASFFNQKYEEGQAALRANMPSAIGQIDNIYGGIGMGQFARW